MKYNFYIINKKYDNKIMHSLKKYKNVFYQKCIYLYYNFSLTNKTFYILFS